MSPELLGFGAAVQGDVTVTASLFWWLYFAWLIDSGLRLFVFELGDFTAPDAAIHLLQRHIALVPRWICADC